MDDALELGSILSRHQNQFDLVYTYMYFIYITTAFIFLYIYLYKIIKWKLTYWWKLYLDSSNMNIKIER